MGRHAEGQAPRAIVTTAGPAWIRIIVSRETDKYADYLLIKPVKSDTYRNS